MPFADLGPVKLHYEVSGLGPPLVLIPGWTLNLPSPKTSFLNA